jgi:hypothetical protein
MHRVQRPFSLGGKTMEHWGKNGQNPSFFQPVSTVEKPKYSTLSPSVIYIVEQSDFSNFHICLKMIVQPFSHDKNIEKI